MEVDTWMKQWRAHSNWRAHIAKYVGLRKEEDGGSPEEYCQKEGLNCETFKLWLEYLKKEDKYVFYMSFATEYLSRTKRSLKLLEKYMNISELRMPLIHDAIVAYAAPFTKSRGRASTKGFSLREIESLVPGSLQTIHRKICDDRDTIVAHCDLKPRNPRLGLFGITMRGKGYYWEDYRDLIPEFEELISAVQEELQEYNQKTFGSKEAYSQEFSNPPACVEEDPGPPSE